MTERRVSPQRITEVEREAIVEAAQDEAKVDLHHRKLAHTLGREERVYVSESTVLRVLKKRGWWHLGRFAIGQQPSGRHWW
jgi:transposase